MKQKSEKTCYANSGVQMICHSRISIMWHQRQMSPPLICQIIERKNHPFECKGTKFSRNSIKKDQFSAHIDYIGLVALQSGSPNYMLLEVSSIIRRSNFILNN